MTAATQHMILRLTLVALGAYCVVLIAYAAGQRKILYYPTHEPDDPSLPTWLREGRSIGCYRPGADTRTVWLMLHGNAGQAKHRAYALRFFPENQPVFILEYPGYGARPGSPSRESIDQAAQEAYLDLRARHPQARIGVVGESIGSGPACFLGSLENPPDKVILVTPFENLAAVAQGHFPFLPARWLLLDRWDNVEALRHYRGTVEIFAARRDEVIPVRHAQALARALPQAKLHLLDCEHNDWTASGGVQFRLP